MSVEIKLSRSNRIYRPDEPLQGKIIIKLSSSISHQGIRLNVNGLVNLQVRGGSAGVIESFYGVVKPIPIVNKTIDVRPSGRIASGTTEIPFSLSLKDQGKENMEKFYETFHGGNISIQYLVTVDVGRGYLHKSLSTTMEFIVESEKGNLPEKPVSPDTVIFYITQDTQRHMLLPELKSGGFRVTGRICSQCSLLDPLNGELTVEASPVPILSIDIHLFRVESILIGEKIATETSLIQTTQIADGDVSRGLTLPIYVMLPRLLTCPTIFAGPFSVEFKVTIVITFQSELSKSYTKFDPKTPKSWVSMQRTYSSLFTLPCTNIICTGFSLRWKVCHWNWSAQNETILRRCMHFNSQHQIRSWLKARVAGLLHWSNRSFGTARKTTSSHSSAFSASTFLLFAIFVYLLTFVLLQIMFIHLSR